MSSERPTNVQLVASFRALLTGGATDAFNDSRFDTYGIAAEDILHITKHWRGELWNALNEIEERLCPLEVETRRRIKNEKDKA